MHLISGEVVLRIYRHHPTPFILHLVKLVFSFLPFFLLLAFLKPTLSVSAFIVANGVVALFFVGVLIYISLVYWLDKLVITNQRVIFINWKYLTSRSETEAMLNDIQEIETKEKGFFSYFKFLDYGKFILQTSATKATILFEDAPDPEGMRKFIYHVREQ